MPGPSCELMRLFTHYYFSSYCFCFYLINSTWYLYYMVVCCGSMTHFYDKQVWGILTYQKLRWHYSRHEMMFLVSIYCWPLFFSSLWNYRVLSLDLISTPLKFCLEDRTVTALEASTITSNSSLRSQDILVCTFRVFDINYSGSSNNIGVGAPALAQLGIPV